MAALLAAVLLTVSGVGVKPDRALGAPFWSIQSTANQFVGGALSGVSCASTTACTAVGGYTDSSNRPEMLAEQWNGTRWSLPPTANPSGVLDSSLTGVSCPTAADCTAVGNGIDSSDNDVVLAGRWNGASWTFQTIPAPAFSTLAGVSCTASDACTAVGSSDVSSTTSQTLAEVWNGSGWTAQTTPNPTGATISALSAVSCTADGACTAVGYYVDSSGNDVALGEQWKPTRGWSIHLPANPAGATRTVLSGVSCVNASACTAVGLFVNASGVQQTLAEHWNGSGWTITLEGSGTTNSRLSAVSCPADNACTAAGEGLDSSGVQHKLAERWDGSSWAVTLEGSGATSSSLSALSCTSDNACTAAGQAKGGTLAARWNGTTWTVQTTPNPPGTGILSGVSCIAATPFCAAVGYSSPEAALAEQWNGKSWKVKPSYSTGLGALHPVLSGVSCTASNACIAVGGVNHIYCPPTGCNHGFTIVNGTLALQWNGMSWARVGTLNPSQATASHLSAVSCAGAGSCTAVGSSGADPLAEAWDGTAWSIQATPPSGALNGVACTASGACTGVGGSGAGTLADRWNGSSWTTETTPNPSGATTSVLTAVSCASAGACVAVGYYVNSSSATVTLAESWNGATWSIDRSPSPPGAVLAAVSCASTTTCIAVGHDTGSAGVQQTLAEQWNGSAWTVQATPNPQGATRSELSGVSCVTTTTCTAVGDYVNAAGTDVTLAERYTG